jgi:hypothetical protein
MTTPKRLKTGGRKKGTPNKNTKALREMLKKFTIEAFPDFKTTYYNLSDKQRAFMFMRLIKFQVPEMGNLNLGINHLSKDNLQTVIEHLKEHGPQNTD